MFMYFPNNYVWSMAPVAALNNGGLIDEIDRACKPILEASNNGDDVGTELFYNSWKAVADRLASEAAEAETKGRRITAADKYYRASLYVSQAERLQSPKWEGRNAAYQVSIDLLLKHVELSDIDFRVVDIPYGDTALPGYFLQAESVDGRPAPIVIHWNGLDSTKEMMYYSQFPQEMAKRGVSTLMVDTGGNGAALRLRGIPARFDTEVFASACIDFLEASVASGAISGDVERIGLVGWSLGGYYAPRAAAFEKRIKQVVAWGANHNWGEVQHGRVNREGENPVPHYWDHVYWVWGVDNQKDFLALADRVNLNGVVEKIDVPFLITHGANDRQINVKYAQQSFEQATASPKRELRIFDDPEGGTEHISIDNMLPVAGFIADWMSETFAEMA